MGGLFAAQNQQLNQLMPEYSAAAQAGGIGSGNFGSLRGQTAVQKARGDAFSKLNAAQLQAALTNQQTGVSAGSALGNVGSQGINAGMNVGTAQMNAPFTNVSNYANLLGSMQVPTTTKSQVQYSPLSQITALGTAGQGGLNALRSAFGSAAGKSILDRIGIPSNIFSGGGGGGGGIQYNPDGSVIDSTVPGDYGDTTGADPGYNPDAGPSYDPGTTYDPGYDTEY
jgi:hypothetical protein